MTILGISGMVYNIRQYIYLEHLKYVSIETTCLIKKYNSTERKCMFNNKWKSANCYDEVVKVIYRIASGSQMAGTIRTENARTQSHAKVKKVIH